MKLANCFAVLAVGAIFAIIAYTISAQEPTASPTASVSATKEDMSKEVDFPSPDGKLAFLIGHGEYEQTIDLIDKKTEKVLQHIADEDMSSVNYKVLWAPDSQRFALMTRRGHPNQDVTIYFLKGDKFQDMGILDLTVDIPKKVLAGKEHPHVAGNNWQSATKWNKDGSLVVTIDSSVDGAGHFASATRTVLLGFDKSGTSKILKSTVKYESGKQ